MGDENETLTSLLEGAVKEKPEVNDTQLEDDEGKFRGENTRLRQRIAVLEDQNQRALPFVNMVTALGESDTGRVIIDRFQKGEDFKDLLQAEKKEVEKAAAEAGLTKAELKEMLDTHKKETVAETTETLRAQQGAQRNADALEVWAKEKFEHYEIVRGTPAWNGQMDATFAAMKNGTLEVPEGADPWKFAVEETYEVIKARNPELLKEKAGASSAEDRAKDILVGGRKTPSSRTQDKKTEIPEDYQRKLDQIRGMGAGQIGGKSFSNPKSNKK